MAASSKLDDLVEKRICNALRDGHSYAAAARAAGIDEATLHRWRAEGRDPEGAKRMREFCARVDAADQEAEDRCIQVLQAALTGDDIRLATDTAWKWLARRRADWVERKGEPQDATLTPEEAEAHWRKMTGTEPPWKR